MATRLRWITPSAVRRMYGTPVAPPNGISMSVIITGSIYPFSSSHCTAARDSSAALLIASLRFMFSRCVSIVCVLRNKRLAIDACEALVSRDNTLRATWDAFAKKDDAAEFQTLDKVRDDIIERLTNAAVEKRIAAIYDAVKTDVAKYAESLALWEVAGDGAGPAPVGPDVKKIAATQGLEGGTSDLVNATQAFADGGIGGSFEFAVSREFGVRQQRWIDTIFGSNAQSLQPVTSRDVEGNRYLSWKTEDQPEFTPSFQSARDDVLRAWRIVEARPLARKAAEEIATEAKAGKTLEQIAAARGGLDVEKAGPFTWLTRGTAPFGSAPELSQPEGLAMPGDELMRAVFDLEPGQTAVAFNEPKTVCYAIRLVSLEPDDAQLKDLFLASSQDPRRLATVADDDTRSVYDGWMKSILERYAVSWKREPRGPELR